MKTYWIAYKHAECDLKMWWKCQASSLDHAIKQFRDEPNIADCEIVKTVEE